MAVAPSFQNFEMLTEPYLANGKMYIRVRNPKTGTERQVRWYSEREYNKAHPETAKTPATDPYFKPQKEVLGFNNGYITIFKGDTYAELDWFKASIARYCKLWGWYIISTEEIPEDLPATITPITLTWESVGNEDGTLKNETQVRMAVEALLYNEGNSQFIGDIGERIEVTVTVTKAIELENNYGLSIMHVMEDEAENIYVWTTASKRWSEGSVHSIRGTVKDHRIYRNNKQTILTRCIER